MNHEAFYRHFYPTATLYVIAFALAALVVAGLIAWWLGLLMWTLVAILVAPLRKARKRL